MHLGNVLEKITACLVAGAFVFALGPGAALAQPGPPVDQDKQLHDPAFGWILYFTDTEMTGSCWPAFVLRCASD
ncbi:MAG: hypothetical protein KAY37_07215 [Phycisphaerae bacterium]|nr:hypothetical protein [Phycisphaerae bacterium]